MAQAYVDRVFNEFTDIGVGDKLLYRQRTLERVVTVTKVTKRFLNLSNNKRVRRSDGQAPAKSIWDHSHVVRLTDDVRLQLNKKAAAQLLKRTLQELEAGDLDETLKDQRLLVGNTIDPLILNRAKLAC